MDPQHPTDPRPETAPDTSTAAYPQVVTSETDVDIDAAGDPVQSAVRTLLRNAPDPGPMPADLSRRIEMSLAQAAVTVVPPSRSGMGAGANNTARYLGAALGVALVVGLLHSGTESRADRALGAILEPSIAVPLATEVADGGPRRGKMRIGAFDARMSAREPRRRRRETGLSLVTFLIRGRIPSVQRRDALLPRRG